MWNDDGYRVTIWRPILIFADACLLLAACFVIVALFFFVIG